MTAPQDPYSQLPGGRLDPALDPDRYDPSRDSAGADAAGPTTPTTPPALPAAPVPSGRLDPALDPDRYDAGRQPLVIDSSGGTSQTLPDLLAEGSFDDKPSPYMFLLGLAGIVAFLLLVAFVFSHLSP